MSLLEIVQVVFFSVSTIGVIIATINHFWFVKDRNAQTLVSITNLLEGAQGKFVDSVVNGKRTRMGIGPFINVITIYCHMHNCNQIRSATKQVHERYVANAIRAIFKHDFLQINERERVSFSATRYEEIISFIKNNKKLFADQAEVIGYYSKESSRA